MTRARGGRLVWLIVVLMAVGLWACGDLGKRPRARKWRVEPSAGKARKSRPARASRKPGHEPHEHEHAHPHGTSGHHHHPHPHPHLSGPDGHHHPY